jgi:phosphate/sulfate permease
MGQRLIFVFGNLVVIVTALLPSACAAFIAMGCVYGFWSVVHLLGGHEAQFFTGSGFCAAFLAVLVILVGEVWCGLWWLGGRFEKFDLSSELRP